MLERLTVSTPDMSCGHCVATIEEEVGALPGVASVTADLPTKRVEIAFDPSQVTQAQIEETLAEAVYPVST
jgi:copper chaperone